MAELTQEELNERVALLKHFRKLLEQQKAKFQEYLNVLEKQQSSITSENTDALLAHTELEQQVVKNIENLQKVIIPVSRMYAAVQSDSQADKDISAIQNDLEHLQTKVLAQNEKNRELLRCHITELRTRIKSFQNPYKNAASVYSASGSNGRLIEIQA